MRTLHAFVGVLTCFAAGARAENIVYPPDAGVLNVRQAPYHALGDGIHDDTAAVQKALSDGLNKHRIVYLPNGTYLISRTLQWRSGEGGAWNGWGRYLTLQGQSRTGTVLRLKDSSFLDKGKPQAVLYTASGNDANNDPYRANGSGNQAFEDSICNLTVETGRGNPGAVGVDYQVSNWGALRDVTIRSGDGQGVAGISLTRRDNGPGLIKNVEVDGFDTGIAAAQEICHLTLENINLAGQHVVGIEDQDAVFPIHNLVSRNAVAAVRAGGNALLTILGGRLTGGETTRSAVEVSGAGAHAVLRDVAASGYRAAVSSRGTVGAARTLQQWSSDPATRLSSTSGAPARLPIRDAPPYQDQDFSHWANVVAYGPEPDYGKGEDDTARVQAAMNSGKSTVYFPNDRDFYRFARTITVPPSVKHILGMNKNLDARSLPAGQPLFRLQGGGANNLTVMERLGAGDRGVEDDSARTLVLKDMLLNGYRNGPGAGPLFVENVCGAPWRFDHPQDIWMRQLNPEGNFKPALVLNNGAHLWILGLKTETGSPIIQTQNGGQTELWGGFAYTFGMDPGTPAFINDGGDMSLSFCGTTYMGDKGFYRILVQETQGGVTRTLPREQAYGRGAAASMPLYLGTGK